MLWKKNARLTTTSLLMLVCISISGCLTTNELINTAATTTAAGVATVAGAGVPATLAVTAGTGVIAGVVTPEPATVDSVIAELPPEQRVEALKHEKVWTAIEHIGIWIVGILALLWFLPSPQEIFNRMRRK